MYVFYCALCLSEIQIRCNSLILNGLYTLCVHNAESKGEERREDRPSRNEHRHLP